MEQMISHIKSWLEEAGEKVKSSQQTLTISQKSNRADLVINVDRDIQNFLIGKIHSFDPEVKILTEEEGCNQLSDPDGRVFIIDPIDGTLNSVTEGENFCIMLVAYESGVGKLGFIYDVMRNELLWGGKGIGVYRNDEPLPRPANEPLSEGLLGANNYLFSHNKYGVREIVESNMETRMYGCANLRLVAILKGSHIAYISDLSPWDYVAGSVLLEEFGMITSGLFGTPLTFEKREYYLAGVSCAYAETADLLKKEG